VTALRNKCLLSLRLFMLYRSVDLSRLWRKVAFLGEQPYIWVQRKGWPAAKWEPVPRLPTLGPLCPWTALHNYVSATASLCPVGSEVFRALQPPFLKFSSNSLSRITRQIMSENGIDTKFWKPHSTRGAGVGMFKELGLSSDQVCEIGAWKNSSTFGQYYLRMNSAKNLHHFVEKLQVHNVSPGSCGELDQTRTPRTTGDLGGSVWESDTQDNGEPSPPSLSKRGQKRTQVQPRFSTPPLRFEFKKPKVSPSTAELQR
jgi:hypothetical protein